MTNFSDLQVMMFKLGFVPEKVDVDQELFHVTDEDEGIKNLVVDCEGSLLVLEQMIVPVTGNTNYRTLLQMNRELNHGAFAVDADNRWIVWRDTLQLNTLDVEELQASVNALSLAMAEHSETFLAMVRDKGGN